LDLGFEFDKLSEKVFGELSSIRGSGGVFTEPEESGSKVFEFREE